MTHQFLAISLRATTLVIRFGLSLLVARTLDIEQAGLFFLYLAGVQIASSLIPMDIYSSTARALLQTKTMQERGSHVEIQRHFGAIVLMAIVLSPVTAVIFYWSSASVGLILALLFTVHIGMEAFSNDIGRLLVPLSKPLLAASYLCFRSVIWIVPAAIMLELGVWSTDALGLAFAWFASSFITAVAGAVLIGRAAGGRFDILIDIQWLRQILKRSFVFLIGSLAFRFVVGGDRFLIEKSLGLEAVAVYGFYVSLAFGLLALIESGNSSWNYPRLVRAIQDRDRSKVSEILKTYLWQNTLGSLALTLTLAFSFPLVAVYLLDPVYVGNTGTFLLVCLGVFFLCVTLPFHYTIYGFGSDAVRLLGMMIGMMAMILAWRAFLPEAGLPGAGLMLVVALGAIALCRIVGAILILSKMRRWPR